MWAPVRSRGDAGGEQCSPGFWPVLAGPLPQRSRLSRRHLPGPQTRWGNNTGPKCPAPEGPYPVHRAPSLPPGSFLGCRDPALSGTELIKVGYEGFWRPPGCAFSLPKSIAERKVEEAIFTKGLKP